MQDVTQIITTKRNGQTLPDAAIKFLIEAYTRGVVPDYQMSAFLMAAFLRGFDARETTTLTECMLHSGKVLDFSSIQGRKVDKHSTGGVGDKVSLILAPIAAACNVRVPMISGRALGHTGGTLDKLESIPGFNTNVCIAQLRRQLDDLGVAMLGQTKEIAPADGLLYALRDVTATVDFIPFITASIMSKKLAEGLNGLVLDVKAGRGAFMKSEIEARRLAEMLVMVGGRFCVPTVAWMTNMDVPLGYKIGNWLEVEESIDCLLGRGPKDVVHLVLQLCGEMITLAGLTETTEAGIAMAQKSIDSGHAFDKFLALVSAQGGDTTVIKNPSRRKRTLKPVHVYAPEHVEGFVVDLNAFDLGKTATEMGVGRLVKEDNVDSEAGIVLHKRSGDTVQANEILASFYTRKSDQVDYFSKTIENAYTYGPTKPPDNDVLIDRLSADGWASHT